MNDGRSPDLSQLQFDTSPDFSTMENPPQHELGPITVDGVTFILVNGQWHFYLSPELINHAVANPQDEVTARRIAEAAVKAKVMPPENLEKCIPVLGKEAGFVTSGYSSQRVVNVLAPPTVFPFPQDACFKVTQQELQPTIDLKSPEANLWFFGIIATGVLSVIVLKKYGLRIYLAYHKHVKKIHTGVVVGPASTAKEWPVPGEPAYDPIQRIVQRREQENEAREARRIAFLEEGRDAVKAEEEYQQKLKEERERQVQIHHEHDQGIRHPLAEAMKRSRQQKK